MEVPRGNIVVSMYVSEEEISDEKLLSWTQEPVGISTVTTVCASVARAPKMIAAKANGMRFMLTC